ncbi:GNAT family N-acetyltransferase [Paenibacillus sp.]|jgi:hypothetical protein|uniref:GNAT family N-acetyltransferase n=1 Tax=Paenibacillus sp. TaxID=58172 RepID=UPI002821A33B|nr:GNAT family N-acetyltransferase [Paenibacillus sp.]MDR0268455.1 GNAT family N-acetyltransferase [Paenibacillus sp.]
MNTVIVRKAEDLAPWEPAWKQLIDHLEKAEIFDTWEWLDSYLSHMFNEEHELFIVIITDREQCVAIAPMCIAKQKIKWTRVRSLQFIVSGTGETGSFFLHRKYSKVKLLKEIAKTLKEHQQEWDWIDLYNLHSLHPVMGLIREVFGGSFDVFSESKSVIPYLDMASFHQNQLASGRIKAIQRKERKLSREHNIKLEVHVPVDDCILGSFLEMHKRRWEDSLFKNPMENDFYREIVPKLASMNCAHFSYLEIGGSIASAMLTFSYRSKVYLYITSFSQQYMEYGVGLVLLNRVMEHYLNSGAEEIDFMSGAQEYKFFWADRVRLGHHIRLISRDRGSKLLKAWTLLQMNKEGIRSLFPVKRKKLGNISGGAILESRRSIHAHQPK